MLSLFNFINLLIIILVLVVIYFGFSSYLFWLVFYILFLYITVMVVYSFGYNFFIEKVTLLLKIFLINLWLLFSFRTPYIEYIIFLTTFIYILILLLFYTIQEKRVLYLYTFKGFKFIFLLLGINLFLLSFYYLLFAIVFNFYYHLYYISKINFLGIKIYTIFYFFKYDFKWLIVYVWGFPVLFCLFWECVILLFFLSAEGGYVVSIEFQKKIKDWFLRVGDRDLLHIHNVVYHPFKVMGNSFKFSGNYLDITPLDRGLVYISSLFLILVLILFWVQSLFYSIFINWLFLGVWHTECVYFDSFFKFVVKSSSVLTLLIIITLNLYLAVAIVAVIFFILCFSFNLYINYNVNSGADYEPIYFYLIGGQNYCMVTFSQFRVYNNVWYFNDINWVLENNKSCKDLENSLGKGLYCLSPLKK